MNRDPIVEEVHRIREQMWDDAGGDLDRLIEFLRAGEAQHQDRIISKAELDQLRNKNPSAASAGCLGLFADQPELMDQTVTDAMAAREHPLRRGKGKISD